ncbi:hypothetical protein H257_00953 [Aphanomyces astaci]|uniref:Uncharacterized protein n=1 Tax=Aphanomyces astaci TaxID=112090 RepID=W4H6Y5_APHAT|nr:hypothetical protein H257_00953 [Aphanomyces astaci]ETV87341.1 hypothetical protein H257_00953 [Aphanomyces astaci]|eukprot:XP_009822204.1 hypothetical protein H257_00953 [Aphanomyces astaci]
MKTARLVKLSKKWLRSPATISNIAILTCAVAGAGATFKRYAVFEDVESDKSMDESTPHQHAAHHELEQFDVFMMMMMR